MMMSVAPAAPPMTTTTMIDAKESPPPPQKRSSQQMKTRTREIMKEIPKESIHWEKPQVGDMVFSPRLQDVVGSRIRTWKNHPGNALYRSMVEESVRKVIDSYVEASEPSSEKNHQVGKCKDRNVILKQVAQLIYERMTGEEGKNAVFLKEAKESAEKAATGEDLTPTAWNVMKRDECLNKILLALRNTCLRVSRQAGHLPPPKSKGGAGGGSGQSKTAKSKATDKPKKQVSAPGKDATAGVKSQTKQNDKTEKKKTTGPSAATTEKKTAKRKRPPERRWIAKSASPEYDVHPCVLKLITHICNGSGRKFKCFPALSTKESSTEMILRKQLTHRYLAFLREGREAGEKESPASRQRRIITFSERLLAQWGGILVVCQRDDDNKNQPQDKKGRLCQSAETHRPETKTVPSAPHAASTTISGAATKELQETPATFVPSGQVTVAKPDVQVPIATIGTMVPIPPATTATPTTKPCSDTRTPAAVPVSESSATATTSELSNPTSTTGDMVMPSHSSTRPVLPMPRPFVPFEPIPLGGRAQMMGGTTVALPTAATTPFSTTTTSVPQSATVAKPLTPSVPPPDQSKQIKPSNNGLGPLDPTKQPLHVDRLPACDSFEMATAAPHQTMLAPARVSLTAPADTPMLAEPLPTAKEKLPQVAPMTWQFGQQQHRPLPHPSPMQATPGLPMFRAAWQSAMNHSPRTMNQVAMIPAPPAAGQLGVASLAAHIGVSEQHFLLAQKAWEVHRRAAVVAQHQPQPAPAPTQTQPLTPNEAS